MGKRPFVRFYHMDWAASGSVYNMTMAEVGTYWTLLVRQMVDGYVPSDREKLCRLLNVRTPEEVDALMTPAVTEKFVPVPGNSARMFNKRLAEVIEETDAASQRSTANIAKRWEADGAADGKKNFVAIKKQKSEKARVAAEALVTGAGVRIVGTHLKPERQGELEELAEEFAEEDFRLVGDYVGAGQFWKIRKEGEKAVSLALVIACFRQTLEEARFWDKKGRSNVDKNGNDFSPRPTTIIEGF